MKNLHDVWHIRFLHYVNELQKYLKYVFTGHLAIVIVFVLGAGGYQYSEWLKTVSSDFPGTWLVAFVIGVLLAFSIPTTLIREPDQVYLLPLETKLMTYMKKALSWTFWSQLFVVVVPFIVALPLLSQVSKVQPKTLGLVFILILLMKWWNVQVEFAFRWSNRGQGIWGDRIVRALVSIAILASAFTMNPLYIALLIIPIVFYYISWTRHLKGQPFPYEHFVEVEQNRMLRFYRFANYFTDVPHIQGSIHRRAWLNVLYGLVPSHQKNAQDYLVFRTFVRTDDTFYLWLRLTLLSALGAAFIGIPIVVMVFVGALSFASAIQIKQALSASSEFRMDMLFPIDENARSKGILKLVRVVQVLQALIVLVTVVIVGGEHVSLYALPIVVLIVSEITLKMSN
ncbi:ABC transporter permease [Paenisporosarcina antarctica]|uniref:ABC transporter permease n=1 Tax=Paenisporosarcina antarctica TaxID=417367 RepID=A0A4P6ZW18_9BACL|nr:ABC transporter permease [Paenisporosarcina antarctica]QBP40433.1 ABC transporter permease [Paenisporosarcina antarctica]